MRSPDSLKPVPEWFLRELRAVDSSAAVRWNPAEGCWQIMRPRVGEEVPNSLTTSDIFERSWWKWCLVWNVSEKDGTYRDLDMRVIHAMRKGDAQHRDWRDILVEIEEKDEERIRDERRRLRERREEAADALWSDVHGTTTSGPAGVFTHAMPR